MVGVLLGAVYDLLRIRRIAFAPTDTYGVAFTPVLLSVWNEKAVKRRSRGTILLFVEDILFALLAAVLFLLLFYGANNGVVRWYAFFGAGASFCVYRLTIGRLIMRLSDRIISGIRTLFIWLYRCLVRPVIGQIICPCKRVLLRIAHCFRSMWSRRKEEKLLRQARKGILPPSKKEKKYRKSRKREE